MLNSMSMQGMMQNQMQMQQQQQQQFQQMQMMQMQQQFQQQIHNPMLQQQQQHQQPNNPIQNSMKNSLTNPMQIPQPSSISSNNAPHNENDHQSQGQNSQNDVKKVQFMSQMLPPKPASERNVTFGTFVPPSFTSFANHPQPGQLSVSNPHQLDADLEGVDFDQSDDNSPLGTPAPMPTSFSLDFKNMGWDTDDETTSPLLSDSKSNTTITRSRSANVHLADDWDLFPDIF
ncbi:hypothetical protein TRFO_28473 [Tritrichomonas foetus]|uniref:Uncharacterized protein n=1 Tax=Tritrichomonas foetus TaxID=1144522 RepID=A0A1J4JZY4_9EUKA|nr:hypothetical protein TRFO_28473 [Tritrichomonas foetus]|eukprot:OHT04048.1 hypothetical protein TRFO_28473 [Tritrichomonas foetus]